MASTAPNGFYNLSDILTNRQRTLRELTRKLTFPPVKPDPLVAKSVSFVRVNCYNSTCVNS